MIALPAERPLRVLFVCTGNICRSPTAEGVARARLARSALAGCVEFDSAGTHDYHVGEPPDPRTVEFAARHGYDLSPLRARRLVREDFARFDLLLAMDAGHLAEMKRLCPPEFRDRIALFMSFVEEGAEVSDPYYGGESGFRAVLDCCERGVEGLFAALAPDRGEHRAVR